jgi:hypothetical protein
MQLRSAAILRELDQEIGNRALARLDAGLVGGIGDRVAARRPREERRRAGNLEIVADLRRPDRRVRKAMPPRSRATLPNFTATFATTGSMNLKTNCEP